jgi:hypothetical protein
MWEYPCYKRDTGVMLEWLENTAALCGWRAPPVSPQITQVLLQQAKIVSESTDPRTTIPQTIYDAASRAIATRRRYTKWFQRTGYTNGYSNERHIYFANKLEEALRLLAPTENKQQVNVTAVKQVLVNVDPITTSMTNRFASLEAENPEEEHEVTSMETTPELLVLENPSQDPSVHDLEDESDVELSLDVFCLLEKLHETELYVIDVWRRHKCGDIPLSAATLTTNSVIALAAQAEEKIISYSPKLDSWGKVVEVLGCRIKEMNQLQVDDGIASSQLNQRMCFGEFTYLPTWCALSHITHSMQIRQSGKYWGVSYPLGSIQLPNHELLDAERRNRWCAETHFLGEIMARLKLKEIDKEKIEDSPEDEITRALTRLCRNKEVSITAAFAAQVLLDIQGIDAGEANKHMTEIAQSSSDTIAFKRIGDGISVGSRLQWPQRDLKRLDFMAKLLSKLGVRMEEPALADQASQYPLMRSETTKRSKKNSEPAQPRGSANQESPTKVGVGVVGPSQLESFVSTKNPVYAGTIALTIQLSIEALSIALENHHITIFPMAHLYNVARKTNILNERWQRLEEIIKFHEASIFGGDPPESRFSSRMLLKSGMSLTQFARDSCAKRRKKLLSGKGNPALSVSKTFEILLSHYDDHRHTDSFITALAHLEKLIHPEAKSPTSLTALERWTVQALEPTEINYIALTRTCSRLLRRIRTRIQKERGNIYPVMRPAEGDSNDLGLCGMTLSILEDFDKAKHKVERAPEFAIAVQVISDYLTKKNMNRSSDQIDL